MQRDSSKVQPVPALGAWPTADVPSQFSSQCCCDCPNSATLHGLACTAFCCLATWSCCEKVALGGCSRGWNRLHRLQRWQGAQPGLHLAACTAAEKRLQSACKAHHPLWLTCQCADYPVVAKPDRLLPAMWWPQLKTLSFGAGQLIACWLHLQTPAGAGSATRARPGRGVSGGSQIMQTIKCAPHPPPNTNTFLHPCVAMAATRCAELPMLCRASTTR